MRQILSVSVLLLAGISLFAHEGLSRKAKPMFIATTGRITAIDNRTRTITVSRSEGPAIFELASGGLDELTVTVTADTIFQDGADPIRFEDFKIGETISIHGRLRGPVLTASRVAKWD